MRALRTIVLAFLGLAVSPAHANLVTIDPNAFAAGTDISNAIEGVTLSRWSHSQGDADAIFSPIYAAPCHACSSGILAGEYEFAGSPGSGSFANTPGAARWVNFDGFGTPPTFSVFRADFDQDTNFVSIISSSHGESGDPPVFAAFSSDGTLLSFCSILGYSPSNFCTVTQLSPGPSDEFRSVYNLAINTGTNDIAFVLSGGSSASAETYSLSYANVPEPAPIGLMALGLGFALCASKRPRRNTRRI